MIKIREMSDIHLEFGPLDVPVVDNEKDTVLILSGDIGVAEKPSTIAPFVVAMAARHRHVFMILGNHEHYSGSLQRSLDKIGAALVSAGNPSNVSVMENQAVVLDNVAFIGGTLWTDCHNTDPLTVWQVERTMNDFRGAIRNGPKSHPYVKKFHPMDAVTLHRQTKRYIFDEIVKHKAEGRKVVVFTHHAPSTLSIAECYKVDHHGNGGYASALEEQILDTKPDLWFHGHTHVSFDYMLGDTRIICNPRGYAPDDLNPNFNPNLILEV